MLLANKTVVDVFRYFKNIFIAANEARPEYEEVEEFVPSPGARRAQEQRQLEKKTKAEEKAAAKAALAQAKAAEKAAKAAAKKVPNGDVPEQVAKKHQEEFDIDIPMTGGVPGNTSVPEGGNGAEDKPEKKSAAQIEGENIARQIEANEAERKAAKAGAKQSEEQKNKDELASIIRKAAGSAATSSAGNVNEADNRVDNSQGDPVGAEQQKKPSPLLSPMKKGTGKGSTLASNKITDDADLDIPETTATQIRRRRR